MKFLPPSFPLPTFYTAEEQELLQGTSLAEALDAKLASLEREFEQLRQATEGIAWCQRSWWDEKTGTRIWLTHGMAGTGMKSPHLR